MPLVTTFVTLVTKPYSFCATSDNLCYSGYKTVDKSWMKEGLYCDSTKEHIRSHLWQGQRSRNSKLSKWWLQLNQYKNHWSVYVPWWQQPSVKETMIGSISLFLLELILSELLFYFLFVLLFLIIRMVSFRECHHHICTPRNSFRHLPTSRGFSGHFNISIGHPSSYKLLKVSINTGYFDSIYRDLDTRSLSCKKRKTNENKRI